MTPPFHLVGEGGTKVPTVRLDHASPQAVCRDTRLAQLSPACSRFVRGFRRLSSPRLSLVIPAQAGISFPIRVQTVFRTPPLLRAPPLKPRMLEPSRGNFCITTIFQNMRRNTKANHSFPQCLIKQWINNSVDKYPNALQICDKELNFRRKEAITSSLRKISIRKIQKHKQARMTTCFSNI